jgi:hypothetical protein
LEPTETHKTKISERATEEDNNEHSRRTTRMKMKQFKRIKLSRRRKFHKKILFRKPTIYLKTKRNIKRKNLILILN